MPKKGYRQTEEHKRNLRKHKNSLNMKGHTGTYKRTKEMNQKMKKAAIASYQNGRINGMQGKQHTVETIQKMRETKSKPDVIKKMREAKLNNPIKKFSNTSIELKIQAELNKRGFVKDKDYFCNVNVKNIANVDIFLPALKIIIECDGCRYHACQQCGFTEYYQEIPEKDVRKTKLLNKAGYKVYRFWEHDINKSSKDCINTIASLRLKK